VESFGLNLNLDLHDTGGFFTILLVDSLAPSMVRL